MTVIVPSVLTATFTILAFAAHVLISPYVGSVSAIVGISGAIMLGINADEIDIGIVIGLAILQAFTWIVLLAGLGKSIPHSRERAERLRHTRNRRAFAARVDAGHYDRVNVGVPVDVQERY